MREERKKNVDVEKEQMGSVEKIIKNKRENAELEADGETRRAERSTEEREESAGEEEVVSVNEL